MLMDMFVVYENPLNAPGMFVVRRWEIVAGKAEPQPCEATRHVSLKAARESIPLGHVRLDRRPDDDPAIREVWV